MLVLVSLKPRLTNIIGGSQGMKGFDLRFPLGTKIFKAKMFQIKKKKKKDFYFNEKLLPT